MGPRPAGSRVGGAICCVAAPAEALSHGSLFGRWRNLGRRSKELEAPAFVPVLCSQIWDDRLADGQTHRQTDKSEIGLHRKFLSFRARANFTLAVNL